MQAPTLFLILFAFAEPRYSQEVVDSAVERINRQVQEVDSDIRVMEDVIEKREGNKLSAKDMKRWIPPKLTTKPKQLEFLNAALARLLPCFERWCWIEMIK